MADDRATILRQTQRLGQIRHHGGNHRNLGFAVQLDVLRRDARAIHPGQRVRMASQQLKLRPGQRSRDVCLILSKDRNNAAIASHRKIGMEQPLHESEYGDITPNSKRNRQ